MLVSLNMKPEGLSDGRFDELGAEYEKHMEMTEIQELEANYCKAANALRDYRQKHGFNPNVEVIAKYREDPPKKGVICSYGEVWAGVDATCVPVLLSTGVLQNWNISNLTVCS